MGHHRDNWFSRHFITHAHVMRDRLVRISLVVLAVSIMAALGFSQYNRRSVQVAITITPLTPAYVHASSGIVVAIANQGAAIKSGLVVSFSSTPSLLVHALDAQPFPVDGVARINVLPVGAEMRYRLDIEPTMAGEQEVRVVIRRENSSKIIASAVQTISIPQPQIHLKAFARYYSPEGEQLGRGPLPPQVGETTTYYGVFQIPFEGYHWKTVQVSARLGDHVSWANFVPDGSRQVRYDAATGRIYWELRFWPATDEAGLFDAGTTFAVKFDPAAIDVGKTATLLDSIEVSAITDFGEHFSVTVPDITTSLVNDPLAALKGVVEP